MDNITFKDWLIIKERELINLDKKPKPPKGKIAIVKLGKVQPDTLFSNGGTCM